MPLWLPFAVALALEAQFFVGGLRGGREPATRGRLPLRRDLEEFGWSGEDAPGEEEDEFWQSPPVPVRRRRLGRRLVEAALVLGAVALVAWAVSVRRGWDALPAQTRAHVEATLSKEATKIAGHAARVRCDTTGRHVGFVQDADGVAEVGGRNAWLTPSICFTLYRLAERGDVRSFSGTGRAIAVLAHEAWHLHGLADEGETNCRAFRSGVAVGVDLGLSHATARAMMREQLADNASDSASDPRYLVPRGCRVP